MTNCNRKEQLKAIHASKKVITSQKVDKAIQRLLRANNPINFNSAASDAIQQRCTA